MKKEKTEIKIVNIKECVPNSWNPNEMNARQFASLKKALTKYGQTKPIQVGVWPNMKVKDGYVIVGGYHTWKVLGEIGETEIEANIHNFKNEDEAKLYGLTDNIHGSNQQIKLGKLAYELTQNGYSIKDIASNLGEEDINVKDALDLVKEEIDGKLKEFNNFNGDVYCRAEDLNKGLFIAKRENKKIIIKSDAPTLEIPVNKKTVVSVIEDKIDVDSVISINYISSINSDLRIMSSLSKTQLEEMKKYLFESGSKIDDDHDVVSDILLELKEINFKNYKRAVFFTEGVPYGRFINNVIPNSHVFRNKASYFIFDNLFTTEYRNVFFSFLNFSIFDDDESNNLLKLFKKFGFYTKNLSKQENSSTRYNFSNYVEHFPYDILHIGSHGGHLNGNYVRRDFVGKDGDGHVLEYFEIVDFENTGRRDYKGEVLIGVTSKFVFLRLDGYRWGSDELSNANIDESVYKHIEELSSSEDHEEDNVVSVKHDGYIPYFGHIECLDNVHQGNFHYLAGQTSPIVFNNSCSSWDEIAKQWIGRGVRGYIGTLWDVGNDTAKYSADAFYGMILRGNSELICAVYNINKRIKNKKYKDIYIFWGLPFVKLDKPSKRVSLPVIVSKMSRFLIRLLSNHADKYQKYKSEKNGIKDNSFDTGKFILKVLSLELKSVDIDELEKKLAEASQTGKGNK